MEMQIPDMFFIASFVGSIAFALSGYFMGVKQKLDMMGIFIVAMLTANGGGAMRDVLVGRTPNILKRYISILSRLCCFNPSMVVKTT